MYTKLDKHFEKIGASVRVVKALSRDNFQRHASDSPWTVDIVNQSGIEFFELRVNTDNLDLLELDVLEVKQKDRHLVLLARQLDESGAVVSKEHFLCGHDERHLFVASVNPASRVDDAKASLKPQEILRKETGIKTKKRNRRKTKLFKRQGEWFFIPSDFTPDPILILRNEALSRGNGSKPHMAQYAYRYGGEAVKVCEKYPSGLTLVQYANLIKRKPSAVKFNWQDRRRNAAVYVRGKIRHADHATIVLTSWHRVLMNTERHSETVAFLD